jgi:hypothetical protein
MVEAKSSLSRRWMMSRVTTTRGRLPLPLPSLNETQLPPLSPERNTPMSVAM